MAGGSLAGLDAYQQGKPCPKCGRVRTPADTNPAWQCPKCGIAYLKFPGRPPLVTRFSEGTRVLAAEGVSDRSVYALVAANLFAAAVAIALKMDLGDLMLVYWLQSVTIGLSFFVRMLSLRAFSTEGIKTHSGPMAETTGSKISMALFFLFHFNCFHLGYLVFMVVGTPSVKGVTVSAAGLALCGIAFAINHAYSLFHNIRADREGRPNIGTMMMLPYARIVPMHLVILLGDQLQGGTRAMLLFIALKVAADVVMHVVEHHVLAKGRALTTGP